MLKVIFKREITKEVVIKALKAYAKESYAEEEGLILSSDGGRTTGIIRAGQRSNLPCASLAVVFPIKDNSVTIERHAWPSKPSEGYTTEIQPFITEEGRKQYIENMGKFLQEYIDGEKNN